MKIILSTCAVLSLAVIANGFSIENDLSKTDTLSGFLSNKEAWICVKNEINDYSKKNSDLDSWFDDVFKTFAYFLEEYRKCALMDDTNPKEWCFHYDLKNTVMSGLWRLADALPEDKKKPMKDSIFGIFTKCF